MIASVLRQPMPPVALLLAVLFSVLSPLSAGAGYGAITVIRPWARAAAVAGRPMAVYLRLQNSGPDDRLTGIETPAAARAALHESERQGGITRMRMVKFLDLPGGGGAELAPGGAHIMLFSPRPGLSAGTTLSLTLFFRHHPPLAVVVPVYKPGSKGPVD